MTKKNRIEINGHFFDSEGEAVLYLCLIERDLADRVSLQFQFVPDRRWRFDFAFPDERIAVEVEGGVWVNGGHNRGSGYTDNCRKYNRAAMEGWTVLRFTTDMVNSLEAIDLIERMVPSAEAISGDRDKQLAGRT